MTGSAVIQFIDRVNDAVKAASPIATMMGLPFLEKITGWVDVATEVGQNAVARAEEGKLVLSSNDKEEINRKLANIQAVNDEIAANIANS
jgi:hypothetical protein